MNETISGFKQPLHLFLGTAYTGGEWDAILDSSSAVQGYVGLGFDITSGIGFLGGAHFGPQSYLNYDNSTFTWQLKEGYGYRGLFVGFSGDLRIDKLFSGQLFSGSKGGTP